MSSSRCGVVDFLCILACSEWLPQCVSTFYVWSTGCLVELVSELGTGRPGHNFIKLVSRKCCCANFTTKHNFPEAETNLIYTTSYSTYYPIFVKQKYSVLSKIACLPVWRNCTLTSALNEKLRDYFCASQLPLGRPIRNIDFVWANLP